MKIFRMLLTLAIIMAATSASAATITKTLLWDANTEADIAGYRLYQSNVAGGPYTLKANVGKVTTTVVTLTATVPTTFAWVLTALDTAGNESGYSNEVTFLFSPDVTAPAAPGNLRMAP